VRSLEQIWRFGDYALEWDLSDRDLLELSGIKKCPKCGGEVTVDDGVL